MVAVSTHFLMAVLICFANGPPLTVLAAGSRLCTACTSSTECPGDMFCCPFQSHCIPKLHGSCLCPHKGSDKSLLTNNERVWRGEKDCDGILCEFCPGTDAPENTCKTDKDLCVAEGAQKEQTSCVEGDHCSCSGGFVCSDTKREGECARGTGGYIFCEKKNGTDAISTTSIESTTPSTVAETTAGTTTITQAIPTAGSTGTCELCETDGDCDKDFFCCPFQLLCIPKSHRSCLCPDKTSSKTDLHNNERVFKGETNCDGILCKFCPGTDQPQNTCNIQGSDTLCRSAGATNDQAYCEHGDHCRCMNGFVCSDTLLAGECGKGTGAYVHCVKDKSVIKKPSSGTQTPKPGTQKPQPGGVARNEDEEKKKGSNAPVSSLNYFLVPSLVIAVVAA